jgi:hypothetical protein
MEASTHNIVPTSGGKRRVEAVIAAKGGPTPY